MHKFQIEKVMFQIRLKYYKISNWKIPIFYLPKATPGLTKMQS